MRIRELIDVIDPLRKYTDQHIEIAGKNGEVSATFKTNSILLPSIEDREIDEIEAKSKGVIRVWIK